MYQWLGIAILLLIVVIWNNYRVHRSRRKRNQKNFRKSYYDRKKNNKSS
ncbi:MAG TPA: hypothetical protein PKW08_12145 [Flavobacteriaceae bacterium]|nr:hypothetical protein [Alteromonas sp.]HPF12196.1 hypothetical protein [Flavobacteriaceae bacterium]HQU22329.1 hypothetical protein [Flavobacteriaceae bacterium]HQU66172.1 hypothetical protein [Flavobacteriaceae bacterium]